MYVFFIYSTKTKLNALPHDPEFERQKKKKKKIAALRKNKGKGETANKTSSHH